MRILLIGGTGFIGPHVARQLAGAGHQVTVFHRGAACREPHIHGDRGELPAFRDEFRRLAPEAVIDFIVASERPARVLVETFRGIAGRLVLLSSMDVYRACAILHRLETRDPDPVPLTEDSPLRTQPPYPPAALERVRGVYPWIGAEYDKVPAERLVLAEEGAVLRLPMIYGPGDPLHRLFPILQRVADRRPAILIEEGAAQWRGPRGYVENVAAAIALAATDERARGRAFNVAEPENFSELDWTRRVAQAAGFAGRIAVTPAEATPAHLRFPGNTAQHWSADSGRIRRELGYREPVTLEEALRRTIAWERAHPPEKVDPAGFDYAAEDTALARLTSYSAST